MLACIVDNIVLSEDFNTGIKGLLILFDMKAIWILLSLVFGVLFFFLGCLKGADMIQYFGAIVMLPGLIGLLEKLWPEEEVKG